MTEGIGDRIKRMRKERGWTGEYLAAKIGTTKGQISKHESGLKPTHDFMQRYADAFEVHRDYIEFGAERTTSGTMAAVGRSLSLECLEQAWFNYPWPAGIDWRVQDKLGPELRREAVAPEGSMRTRDMWDAIIGARLAELGYEPTPPPAEATSGRVTRPGVKRPSMKKANE